MAMLIRDRRITVSGGREVNFYTAEQKTAGSGKNLPAESIIIADRLPSYPRIPQNRSASVLQAGWPHS
jgi:hypothetical protein